MKQEPSVIYVGKQSLGGSKNNPHDYAEAVHLYELLTEVTKILLRKVGICLVRMDWAGDRL